MSNFTFLNPLCIKDMSNTQNYVSWGEFLGNKYENVESQDWYPFHNQWRGHPLSQRAWIKQNISGVYPYAKPQRVVKPASNQTWNYTWYFPCSTIFPVGPQFTANREIILER